MQNREYLAAAAAEHLIFFIPDSHSVFIILYSVFFLRVMSELLQNLGIDPKLLLAQAVNFLLVLWLLNRFVFKRILGFLEQRRQNIQEGIELREKAGREMQRIDEARSRELQKARQEADSILSSTRAEAAAKEREIVGEARGSAEEVLQKAKAEAERQKEEAVRAAQKEIQQRALFVTEKVLARALTPEDERRMAKEVEEHLKGNG